VLADGDRHGYAIMSDIAEITNNSMKLGPGTLYSSIKRMLAAGWIEESDERPDRKLDDERRRYYRLTSMGRKVVAAESQRMSTLVKHAQLKQIVKPA
jgi:DNA-binding PadR family transcriptional regulator